jgi:AcrR family transcriptional regulator
MNIEKRTFKKKEDTVEKIIDHLSQRFLLRGYRKFSMDQIASSLQISKKTIYKHFTNKENIVRIVLIKNLNEAYNVVITIIQARSNVVEKFIGLSEMVKKYISIFNDASLKRLSKDMPQLADEIIGFRENRVIPLIKLLLRIGKKKDIILDVPEEIILKVFTTSLGAIVETKNDDDQFRYDQSFVKAFNLLLSGILTKKGQQIFKYKTEVIK